MASGEVNQSMIGRKVVAEVALSLRGAVQQRLHRLSGAGGDKVPADNAAGGTVDDGHDVVFVFLSPMNVNSSSNSATSTLSGIGAGGNWLAHARTQLLTLCGLTPTTRPIARRLIPSRYIRTASKRVSSSYPGCFASGVYRYPHSRHRYRWLPAPVNPSLTSRPVWWHFGHSIPLFYHHHPVGHSPLGGVPNLVVIGSFAESIWPANRPVLAKGQGTAACPERSVRVPATTLLVTPRG
jgi:hypothetical protein